MNDAMMADVYMKGAFFVVFPYSLQSAAVAGCCEPFHQIAPKSYYDWVADDKYARVSWSGDVHSLFYGR